MSEKKVTRSYGLNNAEQFVEGLSEVSNTSYYFFAAKHTSYPLSDTVIEKPEDSIDYKMSVYRNLMFGKRIDPEDVSFVVSKNVWESGEVYDRYDDQDKDLFSKKFFVIVDASSYYHVWKCIDNAGGSKSTIEPDFSSVSEDDEFYQTSDGYVWKYMCSVPAATASKFSTEFYFPIVANTDVVNSAVPGSLSSIVVEVPGSGYDNYLGGNNSFGSGDLRLGGNSLVYDISSNAFASSSNDYYNGCYIYVKGGSANEIGQYQKIVDYSVNSSSKSIILEAPFSNIITTSAVFDIYPGISIVGEGSETTNAVARAIISPEGNVVSSVEILRGGENYRRASAEVNHSSIINPNEAELRVIIPPPGGHGSNILEELGSRTAVVSVTFANSEGGTILQSNDYRIVGLMKDPTFSEVTVTYNIHDGQFLNGEQILKVNPMYLGNDLVTDSTSSTVTSSSADFTSQFSEGDSILAYEVSSNSRMISTVSNVVNSSTMILTGNSLFSSNAASFYIPRETSSANVKSSNTSVLVIEHLSGDLQSNDSLIGVESGAWCTVNTISRSGVEKGFETFIGTYKYSGRIISGNFVEDETIYQGFLSTTNAIVHSVVSNGALSDFYVTNQSGSFVLGGSARGATSNALAEFDDRYDPEIEFMSGDILYMENILPVTRSSDQSEQFKVILEF